MFRRQICDVAHDLQINVIGQANKVAILSIVLKVKRSI
jgi:hypothetical protein